MKKIKKLLSILLAAALMASLLCSGAAALDLGGLIGNLGNLGNLGGAASSGSTLGSGSTGTARNLSAAPVQASTMSVPAAADTSAATAASGATATADGTTNPVYIKGTGGSVVLSDTAAAATAYLYGDFASTGTTVSVGKGWTVYISDAETTDDTGATTTTATTVSASSSDGSDVYAVKAAAGSTVHLESGAVSANTVNSGTVSSNGKAYGVYLDGATLYMGKAVTTEAYTGGATITTNATAGDSGITALGGSSVYLWQGEVYSQGQQASAVYIDNSSLTAQSGGVFGVQQDTVFYAHTSNYSANTALSITDTATRSAVNWQISGCGFIFEAPTALSAAVASSAASAPLSGGTFIGLGGGTAIYAGGYASIHDSLAANHYLRNDAGVSGAEYFALSDGSRSVSDSRKTASGTITVADAMEELTAAMAKANGAYSLPCDLTLQASLVPGTGTHTLDLCGRNIEYDGGNCVIEVPASSILNLVDTACGGYTNLKGEPAGVVRKAASGSAVKVDSAAFLNLGTQGAYGPMISAVDESITNNQATSGVVGILNGGTTVAYSCGVFGSFAGADTSGTLFDVKSSSSASSERAVFCGRSYGLRQTDGALTLAGGICTIDVKDVGAASKNASVPWGLYVNYGTRTQNAAASTSITGGYFYSVATDGVINGRNLMLGDLMAENLSFTDNNVSVTPASGSVTKASTYKIAAPSVMRGTENANPKNEWDNYNYYGYAIYNGMADSASQEYNAATNLYAVSTRNFVSYFTVGDNSIYKTVETSNKKVCTCCGAEYTGNSCPNCTNTRCSVCGKCPNHCTCKNTSLVSDDHFAYIGGYSNGTFKPNGTLTRAEAATIFYRLMQNKNYISSKTFTDVNHNDWYYTAVSCLASKGVINGYSNGKFLPNGQVTRAEFCAMAARFYSVKETTIHFADVPVTYWAHKYIASAVAYGWINDSTGRYYPDQAITRQEVVLFVNNMTDRVPDENYIRNNLTNLNTFSDVPSGSSAYYEIIEAANGHTYVQTNGVETWKALQ
jgi:hypothetical protein